MDRETAADRPIRVGISSCLLGQEVRFDGGHKRDRYLTDTLGRFVEWVPVCPELEIGLGAPRETLRLEGKGGDPRLVFRNSREDITRRMNAWSARRVEALDAEDLCGYVLKKDSPSCGMERVKVYGEGGAARKEGVGLFARSLMQRHPLLPIEEEGRLNDAPLRENFIERVFAYRRFRDLLAAGMTLGRLIPFHAAHKFLILSHSPKHYIALGRLVAGAKGLPARTLTDRYGTLFMEGLVVQATARKHANVLQHVLGYMKRDLSAADKTEALAVIDDYRRGLLPLVAPLTLLRHHLARRNVPYIADQIYLKPHPKELMLRNHV